MKRIFLKWIAIVTSLAVFMSGGVCVAFAEEDGFSVYDTTQTLSCTNITAGENGKLATDGFYRVTTSKGGSYTVKYEIPMKDFYCGFNVKLNPGSVDYIAVTMEAWKAEWAGREAINGFLVMSETGGVVLSSSQAISEEFRGKTLVAADKFKYGQWHRIEIYRCYMSDVVKLWVDGTLFDIALNSEYYAGGDGNGYSFGRYGLNSFIIGAYVNAANHYIDFDNYTYLVEQNGNAMNDTGDATAAGGHTYHNTHGIDGVAGCAEILSSNSVVVQNNTVQIAEGLTVEKFVQNVSTKNADAVRVYRDNTYSTLLSAEDTMISGNVVVVALGEEYFTYYTVATSQDLIVEELYTTKNFGSISAIQKKTVYDGASAIRPMAVTDSALTEKISAGTGGKLKEDRIYTFHYDTTPKIEQFTSLFQSASYTDNYTEFDFMLKDDNTQINLYYNYYTTDEHSNSYNAAINLLNISSNGIAVASDAVNLKNPGVKLVESIEPSQWHRLGIFFSSIEDAVILYYDGVKYEIPVVDGSNFLKYGARAVRWQIKSKRESAALSIDNLYMDYLNTGTIDYTSRLVNKPVLTAFNGAAVESNILSGAQGITVAAFKEKITYADTTAVRLYTDGTYSEEITDNDSYVLTNASKLVLSNNEKLFAYYNMGEATAVTIASDTLILDGDYIHGYANGETVQTFISKITLPAGAGAAIYNGDTQMASSAKIAKDMILRVTSADKTRSKDYIICNGEIFVGSPEYTFSGVNEDATYTNISIDITIPVINYTDDIKTMSILVARYNGEKLDTMSAYDKSIAANFNGELTQQHKDLQSHQAEISYEIFMWEKAFSAPVQKTQLYSSAAAGKKVVVFGDSISAPVNDGYVTMLAAATGADILNAAIAGSRMVDRADSDPFGQYKVDFQNIVDGIITPGYDWSTQKALSASAPNVLNFESIDLANTDAAIIWLGTNDFGTNVALADFETTTKDVLDKLTTNYPDLKIILASPIYRARMSGGDGRNCYEYPNTNGNYLYEFGSTLEKLSKNYSNVSFLDLYNECGITKFSNEKYDYLEDGLHPYKTGTKNRAYKIVNALFAEKLAEILK